MPLTDAAVRSSKPASKTQRLYDVAGLYLEISPKGGRWWRLKYRYLRKEKRLSLGTYPEVGLKGAREARDAARQLLASGQDPGAVRKQAKVDRAADAVFSVRKAVDEWLAYKAPGWEAGTKDAIEASFANHVLPLHGARPASSIRAADIRDLVRAVDAAGAGDTAARLFQRLRSVFRFAVGEGRIPTDPTYTLTPSDFLQPRKVRHRAAMPVRELPTFLAKVDGYEGDPVTRQALRLLLLTIVRPAELRGGLWSEIEWEQSLWRIPASRMKMDTQHLVPLSRQALQLLRQMQSLTGNSKLIFPSPFYPGKTLSENTLNSALARMGYKGMATAHGFRSTFSTAANEASWERDVIERQLAHEERDAVRAAYNHAEHLEQRGKLMQWWADCLDQARTGQPPPGRVSPAATENQKRPKASSSSAATSV